MQSHARNNEPYDVIGSGADRFVLRPLRSSDVVAYAEFIARTGKADLRRRFPANRPERSVQRLFARRSKSADVALVAVREAMGDTEEIIGEIRAQRDGDARTVELGVIVRTDHQRCGIGRALVERMIVFCAAEGLNVIAQIAADNCAAVALAQACGMQVERISGINHVIAYLEPSRRQLDINRAVPNDANLFANENLERNVRQQKRCSQWVKTEREPRA